MKMKKMENGKRKMNTKKEKRNIKKFKISKERDENKDKDDCKIFMIKENRKKQ